MDKFTNCLYQVLIQCKKIEDNDKIYNGFSAVVGRVMPIIDDKTNVRTTLYIETVKRLPANGKDAVCIGFASSCTYDMEIIHTMVNTIAGKVPVAETWYAEKDVDHFGFREGIYTYAYAVNKIKPHLVSENKKFEDPYGANLRNKVMYKPIIDILNSSQLTIETTEHNLVTQNALDKLD